MAKKNEKEVVDHKEYLTELYNSLSAFYSQTHIPENVDDIKGAWIIDQKEQDAIKVVLDVLIDCGADTE